MSTPEYLLVETQGRWAEHLFDRFVGDAAALADAGRSVCVYLVQDAVTAAVEPASPALADLVRRGGTVWVDDFSLAQRALEKAELLGSVVDMTVVADAVLAERSRVVWH